MKIVIIGTRGIPNFYGGFEQFAEYLAQGLVKKGYDVTVYNSAGHPYQESEWRGVKIVHKNDPEDKLGTAGQFMYDLNCILHARKQNYDVILQLGYTSSSIWGWLMPGTSIITTNMDGMEWKRTKYSKLVQKFLRYAEKLGVKFSDYLIADSIGIQSYLKETYNKDSVYIPYGAHSFTKPNSACLSNYHLSINDYDMLIARLEPENSIEVILDGVVKASEERPFLVIGKNDTAFGRYLKNKFSNHPQIHFIGAIYDINTLNNLRYYSNIYFHGHTVGGTNPSLLEAMASGALICANNNMFNSSILQNDAFYFNTSADVAALLDKINKKDHLKILSNNQEKIEAIYSWEIITDQYDAHFKEILAKGKQL